MNAMTTISEAAAVAISEAGRTSTPAEAKADPAPAQAKAPPTTPNEPGAGSPSRSLRRLIIPLAAVGAAAALVLVTSARWNAWFGAAAVQTTDNATVHAETTRLSARVSGNVRHVAVKSFQRV
jgi:membrane fusion protein, multidrug efflux system